MHTRHLRLEGASLAELQAQVLAEHGAEARIVQAEQVTVGGIRGFFARRHVAVTVELAVADAEPAPTGRRRGAHRRDELSTRLGIAALLDDADEAEARLFAEAQPELRRRQTPAGTPEGPAATETRMPPPTAIPTPSTATPDFARLMDELTFATAPARTAAPAMPDTPATPAASGPAAIVPAVSPAPPLDLVPEPTPGGPRLLTGPGDLVLLIGPHHDLLDTVRALPTGIDAPLVRGIGEVDDRRSALAARAAGVEQGRSVLVTCAWPDPMTGDLPAGLARLAADQVWAVVHAGRKSADTAAWVRAAAAQVSIDGLAVLGSATTSTPGTVLELGLPIGWQVPTEAANPQTIG